jgi:hypothetical protein
MEIAGGADCLEQTQQMIDHYFDVMTRGGDFAVYYTDVPAPVARMGNGACRAPAIPEILVT